MSDICTELHNGFGISWSDPEKGFGQFAFYFGNGGEKVICSNELMSKEYIKKVLCAMVDNCELEC